MTHIWTEDIINILQRIKDNSIELNKKHTKRYNQYSNLVKWFDLPIIITSIFSSSFQSLGIININYTNMITTGISMFIAIICSIKLYLNFSSNINNEFELGKSYYMLSINIYKILLLKPTDMNPHTFLDNCFTEYTKLIEQSNTIIKDNKNYLLTVDEYLLPRRPFIVITDGNNTNNERLNINSNPDINTTSVCNSDIITTSDSNTSPNIHNITTNSIPNINTITNSSSDINTTIASNSISDINTTSAISDIHNTILPDINPDSNDYNADNTEDTINMNDLKFWMEEN